MDGVVKREAGKLQIDAHIETPAGAQAHSPAHGCVPMR
jgi:hypothetical protein